MMIETRVAARLLVFNESSQLLLFLHSYDDCREFWATPGGGVEPGESVEEAARREASEEVGIDNVELSALWTGQSEFEFVGRKVFQTETFFYTNHHGEILGAQVYEIHELEGIKEIRWWSLEEIDEFEGLLFPRDLAARLREHQMIWKRS